MRPSLLRYFSRKTRNVVEAEDLTQEALVRSLPHLQRRSVAEAKGYIFRCAINLWHERHRKSRGMAQTVEWNEQAEEYLGSENPPESILMIREELSQILKALEGMNERTRNVLVMVNVDRMKVSVVAHMLGISVRAVSAHLAKGAEILLRQRKRQEWLG